MANPLLSVFLDMKRPYTPFEAWGYDRFGAPGVLELAADPVRRLAARLPKRARVLDVGCGGGQLVAMLAEENPGFHIVGLDLSAQQVRRAERRTAKFGERVEIKEGSALQLPFRDGTFDAVTSIAVVKHWPDQAQGFRELVRVLKPGGALLVAELDRGCTLDEAKRFMRMWRIPLPLAYLGLPIFRTFVAGASIDLEDARVLLDEVGLPPAGAHKLTGLPVVIAEGTKSKAKVRAKRARH